MERIYGPTRVFPPAEQFNNIYQEALFWASIFLHKVSLAKTSWTSSISERNPGKPGLWWNWPDPNDLCIVKSDNWVVSENCSWLDILIHMRATVTNPIVFTIRLQFAKCVHFNVFNYSDTGMMMDTGPKTATFFDKLFSFHSFNFSW